MGYSVRFRNNPLFHIIFDLVLFSIEAEAKEEIQPNCVPVSFDDGDRRQVPIPNIRILPDHFTNLYELASATRDQSGTTRNKLLPSMTDLKFASSSRHSNWDQSMNDVKMTRTSARVRHHSAIDRPSSLMSSSLASFIPTKRVARINSRVPTTSSPEKKIEDERIQTDSISDRKGKWDNNELYGFSPVTI